MEMPERNKFIIKGKSIKKEFAIKLKFNLNFQDHSIPFHKSK